ncbi:MAG TPA: class I SAM-dependent methyltransferase [Streptosporangiaceae bacterium]|nr:class I SAM-dependent methyltransferase [Streptosporangiaceae bacterium]
MAESAGGTRARISQQTARAWIESWDAQQAGYLPEREDRFTVLIDAVEEAVGRPDPLVLDLGCGPGSLAVRLLGRMPAATVVAIDADPLTLALGQAAFAGTPGLSFVDADLRAGGWSAGLDLPRKPDAAVSTTALHWLTEKALVAVYAEVAALLRPGGLLLNGDHMAEDEDTAPVLARLTSSLAARADHRQAPPGPVPTWRHWWAAAASDPDLAGLVAQRDERQVESEHHGSPAGRFTVQVAALRAAGFAEVGTLWQRGYNRLLCGVLPAA